ncbi:MAG: hypothetical protein KM312_08550 [Hydrogenibacillus schlegelii]|uniref:Uncharacterized protein n=1 Tax=Hydrogenibacillus schlegelii TaxID=1484 RepID=A0A947CWB8_HYDSH|nr:hypothetical protein [Hydrogenibacillus schlegelii]MBT9282676.1 hypothetical protein [Hydrogenibacillus schlegelii]
MQKRSSMKLVDLLPYGVRFLEDGRAMVFNRRYVQFGPILQDVTPDWFRARGVEFETRGWTAYVENGQRKEAETFWFYSDATSPRTNSRTLRKVKFVAEMITEKSREMFEEAAE